MNLELKKCFRHNVKHGGLACPICDREQYEQELQRNAREPLEKHILDLSRRISELEEIIRNKA